ncbi:MAG: DNA translocase FtsK 4TM domain-containing protein [Pseudomonadota bacterium]
MAVDNEENHSLFHREVPGVILLFLTAAAFLALASFSPADPSFSSSSSAGRPAEVRNLIGLVGAYFSGLVIDLFGLSSFWLVLALGAAAWRMFRGRPFARRRMVFFGFILLPLSASTALSMIFPRLTLFWFHTPGGGLLGDFLARNLVLALNPIGAGLLTGVLFIVSLTLATGFSLIRGLRLIWTLVVLARDKLDQVQEKMKERYARAESPGEVLEMEAGRPAPRIFEKTIDEPVRPPRQASKPKPKQEKFEFPVLEGGEYQLPSLDLLDEPQKSQGGMSRESLTANARLVEKKLSDFNVSGEVVEVSSGPVITMYEYRPSPGVKISKVAGLADDLAMNMRAAAIRIVAPLPGKAAIGIEIPNPTREYVYFKEVVSSPTFGDAPSLLTLVLGVDIMGVPVVADLQRMPHLLIAGATGSGKSVGLNAIIMSILFKAQPDQVKFLMIDPKRIELTLYKDLPHLIYPVVSDPSDATLALKWAVADMENRYRLLAEKGVRNIESYNRKILKERSLKPEPAPPAPAPDNEEDGDLAAPPPEPLPEPLPYLVIIIDELADLMMVSAKDVETSITRLAQMARAAGIHLILATQRPSVDVLTGVIKANMPTRVSFQVSSKIDSRTILDCMGAEKLLGMGDMLFLPPGTSAIQRIHGAYVSDDEIKRITDFIKAQRGPEYIEDLAVPPAEGEAGDNGDGYDEKYDEAVELVARTGKASISLIQRHLRIGYNRAARIIEIMEREGVVGPADGAKPRQVLIRDL